MSSVRRRVGVRVALLLAAAGAVPVLVVSAMALFEPLPVELVAGRKSDSLRIHDRHGRLLRELRDRKGRRTSEVTLQEVSPHVVSALLAAEDARFRWHPGVDPLAVIRAALQALFAGRVVSGGSTLTQQLARALVPRPRTASGKLREMAVALRIEAALDKDEILTAYLNRIEFGPNRVGIEAASRTYFDKPARLLDLAEAATLVALVRGPTFYDPHKGTRRLEQRRNLVLARVRRRGLAPDAAIALAERTPLRLQPNRAAGGAEHLAFELASGRLTPALAGRRAVLYETTLDADLQSDVETAVRRVLAQLGSAEASAAAVLVVENRSGDVLAYVGSPDYFADLAQGRNDGTRALRQPGSALKPFVYAAAIERLGWTPATIVPDLELSLWTPDGRYVPKNYDGRAHGPVRLRVALANSLNLPALHATSRVGPEAVLATLRRFGFASLDRDAQHYGIAMALGGGEVRLDELAAAYAALARDGVYRPLRYAIRVGLQGGQAEDVPLTAERRVLSAPIARQLTSMLADSRARRPAFGTDSVLDFSFPAAVKTGTSKGLRDNWAIGYTREITVAVWVGNFDGRPMVRSSGVTGAGPVLHAVLERAMRGREAAPLTTREGLVEREICALSGALPHANCAQRVRELFVPGREPQAACSWHELVMIDEITGARAPSGCSSAKAHVFERYPDSYAGWARAAERPLAPDAPARCGRMH